MARALETHRDRLRAVFAERLFARAPRSVLDVGCGAGALLAACAERGVFAVGIEPDARGAASGARVLRADGARLPFAPASFEWVSLRHVPHHLRAPREAFAEAWRVASRGLLIAEPWFDEADPHQRLALRADRFLKRVDRRRGAFDADCLDEQELRALLPEPSARVEAERVPAGGTATLEVLEAQLAEVLRGTAVLPEERDELEVLREHARRGHLGLNGSLILAVRRA